MTSTAWTIVFVMFFAAVLSAIAAAGYWAWRARVAAGWSAALVLCFAGIILIGIINFVFFTATSIAIGGRASLGKVEGDHYFVRDHSRYSEVSASTFHRQLFWEQWTNRSISGWLIGGAIVVVAVNARAWKLNRDARGKK